MRKLDLAKELAKRLDLTDRMALEVIEATFDIIAENIKTKVNISNFGIFSVSKRKETVTTNVYTRKKLLIPSMLVPRFTPCRDLKKRINAS